MADQAQSLRDRIKSLKDRRFSSQSQAEQSAEAVSTPKSTAALGGDKSEATSAMVVTVTSGKGGTGKTNFSVNFAIALAKRGKRVLLIDADFGFSNVGVILGMGSRFDLTEVINGTRDVKDIVMNGYGVNFISGGSGLFDLANLSVSSLDRIMPDMLSLDEIADVIIFDTGAGISDKVIHIINASDNVIVVTTPEPTSILDSYSLLKMLTHTKLTKPVSVIMNKVASSAEANKVAANFKAMIYQYLNMNVEILGYMHEDANLVKSVKKQKPFIVAFPYSMVSTDISDIVDAFLIEGEAVVEKRRGLRGLLNHFMNK